MKITFKELNQIEDMLLQFDLIQLMYPHYTYQDYKTMLLEMIPNQYFQLVAYHNEQKLGLMGFWVNTKLWSGKYIEIDHFIIHPELRSNKIGNAMVDYILQKATKINCKMVTLDCYTDNFLAQKFFFNNGFVPKGFHFVKSIEN